MHLIGESGMCQRAALQEQINAFWGVTSRNAMIDAVNLLERHSLVEILSAQSGKQGRPPQLLRLTEQGREAFLLLFGKEPAPSELDELLKRHKSPEHTALNLEAAEALQLLEGHGDHLYGVCRYNGGRMRGPSGQEIHESGSATPLHRHLLPYDKALFNQSVEVSPQCVMGEVNLT